VVNWFIDSMHTLSNSNILGLKDKAITMFNTELTANSAKVNFTINNNEKNATVNPCKASFNEGFEGNKIRQSITNIEEQYHQLQEIFKAMIGLVAILDKQRTEYRFLETDLICRLINAEKKDRKMQKQLSHILNALAVKNSKLAKAFIELREKAFKYSGPIDFMLLAEHTKFWKKRLRNQIREFKKMDKNYLNNNIHSNT